ncbi:MAG: hypothetical protein ABJE47_07695 [bacterium]
MTAPFTSQLRARPQALQLAAAGVASITVRIEMPEIWDTIKAVVSADSTVLALKGRALEALCPGGEGQDAFVLKLHGWEVLDETVTLAAAGAVDGSIFLLTHRRRRAVR